MQSMQFVVLFSLQLSALAHRVQPPAKGQHLRAPSAATPVAEHAGTVLGFASGPEINLATVTGLQPIQIPLQEGKDMLAPLLKQLSKSCGQRMNDTINGGSKGMHELDSSKDSAAMKKQCEGELSGKICVTQASIKTVQNHENKKLESVQKMQGDGCIPKECTSSSDLEALAAFMSKRAQDVGDQAGVKLHVNLDVDCSAAGGGSVEHSSAHSSQEATKAEVKSFASTLAPPLFAVLVAMAW